MDFKHISNDSRITNSRTVKAQLMGLTVNDVAEVYRGKEGCCCGCRGRYSSSSRTIRATIRDMLALIELKAKAWCEKDNGKGWSRVIVVKTDNQVIFVRLKGESWI